MNMIVKIDRRLYSNLGSDNYYNKINVILYVILVYSRAKINRKF